ncbi:MAG: hypothetical protein P4L51_02135 [Puia sp.]|nr:hypothetical protein [Puia sp.]
MNRSLKLSVSFPLLVVFCLTGFTRVSQAQYYYKDQVVLKQTTATWREYRDNKVRNVKINSFEDNGRPTEGFDCQQDISADYTRITTHTLTKQTPESWLIASYSPMGLLQKSIDTSDTFRSISEYTFDEKGRLTGISNISIETDNQLKDIEIHAWQYDTDGRPSGMLKIKNGADTTFIRFVKDDNGNIVEEHATRFRQELPVVYYYWDSAGRLTDIVRYNPKAQRLLPDNIFEYDAQSRIISQIVVPSDGNEYQKWLYEYNEKNLKTRESCYSKRRELVGRIEYQYGYR